MRFREYFGQILSKKNVKIVIFYIKIIDNVLLRTIFRGIGAYSPDFFSLVGLDVFWSTFSVNFLFKGECSVFLKKNLLWMITMHYPNTIRSHLATIVPVEPFTLKSTLKLRSALHIRYSKVIPRFISRANTAQT